MATTKKNTVALDDLEAEVAGPDKQPVGDDERAAALDLLEGIDDNLEASGGRAWMPADEADGEGATLVGFVTAVYEVGSDYSSEPVPCIDVEDRDGEVWSVRGYHAALGGQLKRLKPVEGDAVAIKYVGKTTNKKGQDLQQYAVRVRRAKS